MSSLHQTLLSAAAALALGAAAPAWADIVVFNTADNTGTDNVLLNPATNVLTVTGTVGADASLVNFTSSSGSGLLNADPSGQPTITGGTGNTAFTQLSFGLADNGTFTRAVFNINALTTGSVVTHVEGVNIGGGFFEQDFFVGANGENLFTIHAINGQFITSITLTAINGATFEDVRQVRLGGLVVSAVPEPMTTLLFAAGLAGIGARLRRRPSAA